MRISTKLFFTCFLFLFGLLSVQAREVIEIDIVEDTTWTKEMSPIIIRGREGEDLIRVVNGAHLTIEPGVIVVMGEKMNFEVTNDCQRGYYEGECIEKEKGVIKYPKVIAKGTADEPIVFTSESDAKGKHALPGDWGSFLISSQGNEIEYSHFKYGGGGSYRYAYIEVSGKTTFKNNIVELGAKRAIQVSRALFENNIVRKNEGTALTCQFGCTIKNNFIYDNKGYAIYIEDPRSETIISNNVIVDNRNYALFLDSNYFFPLEINNNEIARNKGGLYLYTSRDDLEINNNNFFKNSEFAIKTEVYDKFKVFPIKGNWYGIDTGATSDQAGEYFVSPGFDTTDFKKNANVFSFPSGSLAEKEYGDYKHDKKEDINFFSINVKQSFLAGDKDKNGSIVLYKTVLKNLKRATVTDVSLQIAGSSDQEFLVCSILDEKDGNTPYNLDDLCTKSYSTEVQFSQNTIHWSPKEFGALNERYLYFATAIKANRSNTSGLQIPSFEFKSPDLQEKISVTLGKETVIDEKGSTKKIVVIEEASSVDEKKEETKKSRREILLEKKRAKEQANASQNISADDLYKKLKNGSITAGTDPVKNAEWLSYPLSTRKAAYQKWEQEKSNVSQAVSSNISADDLYKKLKNGNITAGTDPVKNAEWLSYPLATRKAAYQKWEQEKQQDAAKNLSQGYLERGKMRAEVVNGALRYVLTTDSGKKFSLFNSAKWRDLDNFVKSGDKEKYVRVFGNYYINKQGQKTGISFSHFEVE